MVLIFIQIYFLASLANSSFNYRLASGIVKQTFEIFNSAPANQTILLRNVPRDNRGAVMLGLGIPEGYHWLSTTGNKINIFIENYGDNDYIFTQANLTTKEREKIKPISGKFSYAGSNLYSNMTLHEPVWIITYNENGIEIEK